MRIKNIYFENMRSLLINLQAKSRKSERQRAPAVKTNHTKRAMKRQKDHEAEPGQA